MAPLKKQDAVSNKEETEVGEDEEVLSEDGEEVEEEAIDDGEVVNEEASENEVEERDLEEDELEEEGDLEDEGDENEVEGEDEEGQAIEESERAIEEDNQDLGDESADGELDEEELDEEELDEEELDEEELDEEELDEAEDSEDNPKNAKKTTYVIMTKWETPVESFKALIEELGETDDDSYESVYPDVGCQMFVTALTPAQIKTVKSKEFVYCCAENVTGTTDTGRASGSKSKTKDDKKGESSTAKGKKKAVKSESKTQEDSPNHLKLLSWPSGSKEKPDYQYNKEAGEGVTIFVIDTGVRGSHEEFEDLNIKTNVIGTYPGLDEVVETPDFKHGTSMMAAAAGKTQGAAKRASLWMVKVDRHIIPLPEFTQATEAERTAALNERRTAEEIASPIKFRQSSVLPLITDANEDDPWNKDQREPPPGFKRRVAEPLFDQAGILDSLMFVLQQVTAKKGKLPRGKTVVNLSLGTPKPQPGQENPFEPLLNNLYKEDVVVVTSAGNTGDKGGKITDTMFKSSGWPDSPMIVVGGVEANGSLWTKTNKGDEITVNAQASKSTYAGIKSDDDNYEADGTSPAAAVVAGLVANFLSNPELEAKLIVKGQVAQRVKNWLIATAKARKLPSPAIPMIACNGENLTPEEEAERDEIFAELEQELDPVKKPGFFRSLTDRLRK